MQDKNLQTELATLNNEESYSEKLRMQKEMVEDYILWNYDNPAVYVGTYGKYNSKAGVFGAWIDLTQCDDYEEFMEVCRKLHADEEDPEFMFQDFDNFPECWYSEWSLDEDTFDKIKEYADMDDKEAFEAYISCTGDDNIDTFRERYIGKYSSEEEFAEFIVGEMYNLEKMIGRLAFYFDYKAYARELFMDGYSYHDGYVFSDY